MGVEVFPSNEEEMVRTIRQAAASGRTVGVRGGRTGGERPADSAEVVISTLGLQGVIEHHVDDLTAEVWAGTRVADLNKEMGKKGQFLPLDPTDPEIATIGGTIADGRPGFRRVSGARPRDVLLGLSVVLGDGKLIRLGGRVVKNVTGYEMAKLFAGSEGTLGVLTRVILRLRAKPKTIRTISCPVPGLEKSPKEFAQTVLEMADRAPPPEALAVIWRVTPEKRDGTPITVPFIAARYEGLTPDAERSATRFWNAFGDRIVHVLDPSGTEGVWPMVRDFYGTSDRRFVEARGQRTTVLRIGHRWSDDAPTVALPDVGRVMTSIPASLVGKAKAVAKEEGGTLANTSRDPQLQSLNERIRKALDPNGTFAVGARR